MSIKKDATSQTQKTNPASTKKHGEMSLKLRAHEIKILESVVKNLLSLVKNSAGEVKHTLWLPSKQKLITVNRGPHIDKKAREQFKITFYSAVLKIVPSEQTRNALQALRLPYGVSVTLQ